MDTVEQRRHRDDRLEEVKRRVVGLARLDGEIVRVDEGVLLVRAARVRAKNARAVVRRLRERGRQGLDGATLEAALELSSPPTPVDAHMLATAHRDLRVLEQKPSLALAREHRRVLARHGVVDAAWVRAKRERALRLGEALESARGRGLREDERAAPGWFEAVVELVRLGRGADEAERLAAAGAGVHARANARRAETRARIHALLTPRDPLGPRSGPPTELEALADRLDAARALPGRARRRRVLDVLRRAAGWPSAPEELVRALGEQGAEGRFDDLVRQAGRAVVDAMPTFVLGERSHELVAILGLAFRLGDEGMPALSASELEALAASLDRVLAFAALDGPPLQRELRVAEAVALAKLDVPKWARAPIARWVAEGLEIELVAEAAAKGLLDRMAQLADLRAARAYATWTSRLSAHCAAHGIRLELPPEPFAHLPRNEDLGVLALCLFEQVAPARARPAESSSKRTTDPAAALDATLGLFRHLPAKAKKLLDRLRGATTQVPGEGRRLFPELAAWLDDDDLLDRYVHVVSLSGRASKRPASLSRAVREDFEHAARRRRERAHLEGLRERSGAQQARLALLRREASSPQRERALSGARARTRRRIAARIERLMPRVYRRELDLVFREILLEAWGIVVPELTPAWRDAVRFWLTIDRNRALLGQLLRAAAATPGADVKGTFPRNEEWLARTRERFDATAWRGPRRTTLVSEETSTRRERRWTLELEEDPLEVLRMGIPFETCLALHDGSNAASTVLNALDANKRVLYVRNESGRVVARKLLAISRDMKLLGYHLYVSVGDEDAAAICRAVLDFCEALARDMGIPLSAAGAPERIHGGFWYDDGAVPFVGDSDVPAYCASLGLTAHATADDAIRAEARAQRARSEDDAKTAMSLLPWVEGVARHELGDWVARRLGARAISTSALRGSAAGEVALIELARSLARGGEEDMGRVLDLAARGPGYVWHRVGDLVHGFPPSSRLASAMASAAARELAHPDRTSPDGIAHLSLHEVPEMLDDVARGLDVLDAVEPTWTDLARALPDCAACRDAAVSRATSAIEALFERAPDPDAVTSSLTNRSRGALAQRAALRVAARHELPGGERALARLAHLRPELMSSAHGVAALLRQARVDRVTDLVVRARADAKQANGSVVTAGDQLEALGDLTLRCAGIERLLPGEGVIEDVDAWSPGPWELAWRRRGHDDATRAALAERAARSRREAARASWTGRRARGRRAGSPPITRELDLLALLGDVERLDAVGPDVERDLDALQSTTSKQAARRPAYRPLHHSLHACLETACDLLRQVEAERRGLLQAEESADSAPPSRLATRSALREPHRQGASPHDTPHSSRLATRSALREPYRQGASPHDTPHSSRLATRSALREPRSVDAGYAMLARRTLLDTAATGDAREIARATILACAADGAERRGAPAIDWARLLESCARLGDPATCAAILDARSRERLRPELVAELWQIPALRGPVAASLARHPDDDWTLRVRAVERAAVVRQAASQEGAVRPQTGVSGLRERVALELVAQAHADVVVNVQSVEELRAIADALVAEAAPDGVAAAYAELSDVLSASVFVHAVARQPPERAAAIREAIERRIAKRADEGWRAWMRGPRADGRGCGAAGPRVISVFP